MPVLLQALQLELPGLSRPRARRREVTTVGQPSVYPREVVKETLARNSADVVLVNYHPSGAAEPSRANEALTQTLKAALALLCVRVLDHLIVAGLEILSMVEKGLM